MQSQIFSSKQGEDLRVVTEQPWCFPCRCVLQSQCTRGEQTGQWLWSFDMEQQCLAVQDLNPSNISREESRTVSNRSRTNILTYPSAHILKTDAREDEETFFFSVECRWKWIHLKLVLKDILQYRMHRSPYILTYQYKHKSQVHVWTCYHLS